MGAEIPASGFVERVEEEGRGEMHLSQTATIRGIQCGGAVAPVQVQVLHSRQCPCIHPAETHEVRSWIGPRNPIYFDAILPATEIQSNNLGFSPRPTTSIQRRSPWVGTNAEHHLARLQRATTPPPKTPSVIPRAINRHDCEESEKSYVLLVAAVRSADERCTVDEHSPAERGLDGVHPAIRCTGSS